MTKITTGPYVYLSNADLSASFNGPAFESRDYYGLGMMGLTGLRVISSPIQILLL